MSNTTMELAQLREQLAGWKEEAKNAIISREHLVWERINSRIEVIAERIAQLEARVTSAH